MDGMFFSDEIVGKTAMTNGGYPIGIVEDFVIDTESGEIKYVLVRTTSTSVKPGQKVDAKGRAVIAFNTLKVVGDNVIIS